MGCSASSTKADSVKMVKASVCFLCKAAVVALGSRAVDSSARTCQLSVEAGPRNHLYLTSVGIGDSAPGQVHQLHDIPNKFNAVALGLGADGDALNQPPQYFRGLGTCLRMA